MARAWQSLGIGGTLAVVLGLKRLLTFSEPGWFEFPIGQRFGPGFWFWLEALNGYESMFEFLGIAIGTLLLAHGFSRTESGLPATARLQILNIVNGDVINLLLGMYVLWQSRRRRSDVRRGR